MDNDVVVGRIDDSDNDRRQTQRNALGLLNVCRTRTPELFYLFY